MYCASLLEKGRPFFNEALLHEDTDKCMEILEHRNFGFAHQVLSFSRADNESISTAVKSLRPHDVDRYITARRYATRFLEPAEAAQVKKQSRARYYRILAVQALRFREARFWEYHKRGLASLGEPLSRSYLFPQILLECLRMMLNPGETIGGVLRRWTKKTRREQAHGAESSQ
jgi:hypothetical protein